MHARTEKATITMWNQGIVRKYIYIYDNETSESAKSRTATNKYNNCFSHVKEAIAVNYLTVRCLL